MPTGTRILHVDDIPVNALTFANVGGVVALIMYSLMNELIAKALAPIDVTALGMTIDSKLGQVLTNPAGIAVIELEIITVRNDLQLVNMLSPIVIIEFGISNAKIDGQPLKAFAAIDNIDDGKINF